MNKYVKIGALTAMLSVAFGAFGAHMLEDKLSADAIDVYDTAVQYHMFHAVGLLLIALLIERLPNPKLAIWAARLLLIGIVLFSGSLYALALSDVKVLGAITPIGGVSFIAGWICVALAARSAKKP
ncbi:DUF423 domain-containing protein [Cohnella cholangitidis]|uniref:DUF423 domain-containing protein n=1 Tax=Cohnella cholangitidis TaxID=2598458 RepID=A0A7G5C378_9BACL|nr:DUF423 domain-containing protein [Cohnella cholangitidis]QMV43662.1 DUF423 domain-containing protein [Cohnella cholangitidis]